jgi:hypothetical protein
MKAGDIREGNNTALPDKIYFLSPMPKLFHVSFSISSFTTFCWDNFPSGIKTENHKGCEDYKN